jgi:hypothetical protein
VEVSLAWEGGRLQSATVLALRDGEHTFSAPRGQRIQKVFVSSAGRREPVDFQSAGNGDIRLKIHEGKKYEFLPA